jgi:hypothetical protein
MSFIGDTDPANDRVARVINVHFDADKTVIAEFLQPFAILNQIRGVNPKRKTNSTVHVLFASVQDKIAACNQFASGNITGRDVKLLAAPAGIYESKSSLSPNFSH